MSFKSKCPTCKKPVTFSENPDRPFCSDRCRLVDLGAWASGDYRIPSNEYPLHEEPEE